MRPVGNSGRKNAYAFLIVLSLLSYSTPHAQTTSLQSNAKSIIQNLKNKGDYPLGGKDTLMDLNGDKWKDILIEYYGMAGTGEKNRVEVYLYHPHNKKFIACPELNDLANPTFHLQKKLVTGYYVGNGGGHAKKLKWDGLKLITLEDIEIDITWNAGDPEFKLLRTDHVTGKKKTATLNIMNLPEEYNYGNYIPVISRQ